MSRVSNFSIRPETRKTLTLVVLPDPRQVDYRLADPDAREDVPRADRRSVEDSGRAEGPRGEDDEAADVRDERLVLLCRGGVKAGVGDVLDAGCAGPTVIVVVRVRIEAERW